MFMRYVFACFLSPLAAAPPRHSFPSDAILDEIRRCGLRSELIQLASLKLACKVTMTAPSLSARSTTTTFLAPAKTLALMQRTGVAHKIYFPLSPYNPYITLSYYSSFHFLFHYHKINSTEELFLRMLLGLACGRVLLHHGHGRDSRKRCCLAAPNLTSLPWPQLSRDQALHG